MSETVTRRTPLGKKLEKIHSTDIANNVYRCGGSASFVPLSKRKGVKLFSDRTVRDTCYEFQRRLHAFGLAPKVFDRFEVDFQGETRYAYSTERAVIRQEIDETVVAFDNHKLCEALEALGLNWVDRHGNNFGHLGKRTVVIDCDPRYFQATVKDGPLFDLLPKPSQDCWVSFAKQ